MSSGLCADCFKLLLPAADGDADSKPGSDDCPIPAFRRVKLSQHLQRGQGCSLNSEQARAKPVLQTEAAASPGRPQARRPHVKIHKSAGVPFSDLSAYLALQIHDRTNQISLLLRTAILMNSPGGYNSAFWQLSHSQVLEQFKARSQAVLRADFNNCHWTSFQALRLVLRLPSLWPEMHIVHCSVLKTSAKSARLADAALEGFWRRIQTSNEASKQLQERGRLAEKTC